MKLTNLLLITFITCFCLTTNSFATTYPDTTGAVTPHRSFMTPNAVISVDYSIDGRWLISGGASKTVDVWSVGTGKKLFSLTDGHTDDILAVKCAPNKRFIASAGVDKTIIIWDIITREKIYVLKGHKDYITSLDFTSDSRFLASASWDKSVIIWDAITGTRLQTLIGHDDNVTSVAFNPDGTKVVTGCGDHVIRTWDVKEGNLELSFSGHTDEIWDVKWSENGKFIASGGWDNKVRVWDVAKKEQTLTMPGHVTDVWSVAFTLDHQSLVTCGGDRRVKLWDLASGELIKDLSGTMHTSDIEEVSISPDNKFVASASRDGSIRVWELPSLSERITILTKREIDRWLEKGDYESTADYKKRMKSKKKKYLEVKEEVVERLKKFYIASVNWREGNEIIGYNADDAYFVVKSPVFGNLKMKVPNNQAAALEKNKERIEYRDIELVYSNGELKVGSMTAYFKGMNRRYNVSS
ncbi:MAG: WD40 repeat domain-containing protein [Bacteroidota bacterium]